MKPRIEVDDAERACDLEESEGPSSQSPMANGAEPIRVAPEVGKMDPRRAP